VRVGVRVAVLAATYVAGLAVLAIVVKPDPVGFITAGAVFLVVVAALDRLRRSRLAGRQPSPESSRDITRR